MSHPGSDESIELNSTHYDKTSPDVNDGGDGTDTLTGQQAWCLYFAHFWSMWTSRFYEYAAILFIQHTFPGDLLPSSINGIAETVCVLVSSSALGRWVDQSPDRLRPLMLSIIANRFSLVLCCGLWLLMFTTDNGTFHSVLFAVILLLGMVEKASRMSNTLSVERDWIPTVASPSTHRTAYNLTHLNTTIRRIDIACKFFAPLAISGVLSKLKPWLAALVIGSFAALTFILEIWGILLVWDGNGRLRKPKSVPPPTPTSPTPTSFGNQVTHLFSRSLTLFLTQIDGLRYYFSTNVWAPSLGIAVLHGSVLAWSGTLITWMLNCGFSYAEVTVAKSVGSVFEFASTFAFFWSVTILSRRHGSESGSSSASYRLVGADEDTDVDMVEDGAYRPGDGDGNHEPHHPGSRTGDLSPIIDTAKWSIVGLVTCLIPTLAALFFLDNTLIDTDTPLTLSQPPNPTPNPTFFSLLLRRGGEEEEEGPSISEVVVVSPLTNSTTRSLIFLTFLSLSFLGRWTYDLSITQLTQITVPAARRSEFGGTEMAIVSVVSLAHWVAAAVWHRQSDFKWLASGSVGAVAVAAVGYVFWVRSWYGTSGGNR